MDELKGNRSLNIRRKTWNEGSEEIMRVIRVFALGECYPFASIFCHSNQ